MVEDSALIQLDNEKISKLQENYLSDRNDDNFEKMRLEVQNISSIIIYTELKKTGAYLKVSEKSYDTSIHFMMMYLKNPEWKCTAFYFRIRCDVLHILYNKGQQKSDKECIMPQKMEYIQPNVKENTDSTLESMIEDSPYWRNILLDCYHSKTFPGFITTISKYHNRTWCFDHIHRLKHLYKYSRMNKRGKK